MDLFNDTYTYAVATTDKSYQSPGGTFTVSGPVASKSVTFSLVTYTVTFTETGLPSGTEWWVNLTNGQSFSSAETNLTLSEANGTYSYSASAPGYLNATGNLTVGGPTTAPVAVSFSSSSSSSSGLSTLDYVIIGVVVVAVAIALVVVLIRRRGKAPPSSDAPVTTREGAPPAASIVGGGEGPGPPSVHIPWRVGWSRFEPRLVGGRVPVRREVTRACGVRWSEWIRCNPPCR